MANQGLCGGPNLWLCVLWNDGSHLLTSVPFYRLVPQTSMTRHERLATGELCHSLSMIRVIAFPGMRAEQVGSFPNTWKHLQFLFVQVCILQGKCSPNLTLSDA